MIKKTLRIEFVSGRIVEFYEDKGINILYLVYNDFNYILHKIQYRVSYNRKTIERLPINSEIENQVEPYFDFTNEFIKKEELI